jgi:protease I
MSRTDRPLDGATVAVLVAPEGTENVGFTEPKRAVSEAGAEVEVLSTETGEARTVDDLDAFCETVVEEFAAASQ